MKRRHALRFENGGRRGETVPLAPGEDGEPPILGRRPGNAIQIVDPSVSGRHAEFVLDPDGVTVRDLGSTNGTRVGDERVSEQRLAHGDVLHFGNVRVTFLDALVSEPAPAARPMAAPEPEATDAGTVRVQAGPTGELARAPVDATAAAAGDGVGRVSADALARARERLSPWTLGLLAVLLVGALGARYWLGSERAADGDAVGRAVVPVPGNLVAEASFESPAAPDGTGGTGEAGPWSASGAAPASFGIDGSARRSGDQGLAANLFGGEWAEHVSAAARAPRAGVLEGRVWTRTDGATARVGLRFESSGGQARALTVWSAPVEAEAFEPLEVRAAVPPGYDAVLLVLQGRALAAAPSAGDATQAGEDSGGGPAGWVELDDASLVTVADGDADPSAGEVERIGEYELAVLGSSVAVLFKIDRVLLSGLAVEAGGRRADLDREARATGVALWPTEDGELTFFAEPELVAGGVATIGAPGEAGPGYKRHQVEFERERVGSILLGEGRDQVRVLLPEPGPVTGRPSGDGFLFRAPVAKGGEVVVQLVFNDERNQAEVLAREAREAERKGEPGRAVELWEQLQDEVPFGAELLEEASAARGRLVSAGLVELRAEARRVERASFFRLVDDYRQCLADIRALAARYAGTEVAAGAEELAAGLTDELAALEGDLERHERARLEAIAGTLRASESPLLAGRVEDYLGARFGPASNETTATGDPERAAAGPDAGPGEGR